MSAKHPLYRMPHYAIIDESEGGMVCGDHVPLWGSVAVAARHLNEGSFRVVKVMISPAADSQGDDGQGDDMARADVLAILEIFTQSMFNLMDDILADLLKGTDPQKVVAWHFSRVFGMFIEARDLVDSVQGSTFDQSFLGDGDDAHEDALSKFTASLHRSIHLFNSAFPVGSIVHRMGSRGEIDSTVISGPAYYRRGVGPCLFVKGQSDAVNLADILSIQASADVGDRS